MNKVTIYTDGSCLGNPGPGGFAIIWLMEGEEPQDYSNGSYYTTNNRMELMAVVMSLEALKGATFDVDIYTDSKYVADAVNKGWLETWAKNGWLNASHKPVKNMDLWMGLFVAMKSHNVKFHWLKGHNNNKFNERCDKLARQAAAAVKFQVDMNNAKATTVRELPEAEVEVVEETAVDENSTEENEE